MYEALNRAHRTFVRVLATYPKILYSLDWVAAWALEYLEASKVTLTYS